MEPTKALSPAKINPQKLLGGSSVSSIVKKISVKPTASEDNIFIIRKQVIQIKDLLNTNILLKRQEEDKKRKEGEQKKFSENEEKLEKSKETSKEKIKFPSAPKLGFLERIKQFIFNIILGRIAIALLPQLPKLSGIVGTIVKVQDTIIDWTGKILDGLVTFVDKGYEAYDQSKKILKGIGGDSFVKVFDSFNGAIGKVIEASIIAAIAFSDLSGGDVLKDTAKKGVGETKGAFGKGISRSLTRVGLKTIGKDATKGVLRIIRPLVKNAPLIGGLLDFGISWALGDPLPKAAFRGVGTALLGAVGTAIGGPIGLVVGGYAGGELGGVLYDMFFANKKPTPSAIQGRAQGGVVTRGGRIQTGPSRTVKKTVKREVSVSPTPLKPGSDVGGEKNITKIFPKRDEKDKNKDKTVNPLGYIEGVYDKTSKINYFGPLFGLVLKKLSGDKVDKVDYKNVGKSLNSWMSNTFGSNTMTIGGFAGGGEVNSQMFMSGEDLTNVIAKSVEESVSSKLDKVIDDLEKQLMLKPKEVEKEREVTEPSPGEDLGDATEMVGGARLLMAAGFPPLAAAILAGNIQAESAWKGQRTPWVLNDGAGTNKGLISWNRSRIVNAEKFLGKPLETATNAEQIKWIKEELKQYGLLDEFMNPQSTEEQLKRASYKYIGWGIEGDRWKYSRQILSAIEKGEKGSYVTGVPTSKGLDTGKFNVVEYITGDPNTPVGRYDRAGHGLTSNYHDHIAFSTLQDKERAKRILIGSGIKIGSEYRPGDPGYHGKNLAIDIPGYQWGGKGSIGQTEFSGSKRVREVLGLSKFAGGGKVKGFTRAILGEEGPEFVIDADSTRALEKHYPGFLDALNKADYSGALKVLQSYASYEFSAPIQVSVDESMIPVLFPVSSSSSQKSTSIVSYVRKDDYMASSYKKG